MMASAAAAGDSSLDRLDFALQGLKSRSITLEKVYNDWRYLRIFWKSYDAAGLKIEAAAEEIAQDLVRFCDGEKKDDKRPPESESLLELASDCDTKTKRLMAEIGEALEHSYSSWSSRDVEGSSISSSRIQFQLLSPAPLDNSFWTSIVKHLQSNVLRISRIAADHLGSEHLTVRTKVYSLYDSLKSLEHYIAPLFSHPKFSSRGGPGAGAKTDDVLPTVDACLGHVMSVVLRIADRCSDHWLDCKTGRIEVGKSELTKLVEDLHHEIHPMNPDFMEFHLNFLLAIYRHSHKKDEDVDFVMQFCYYLFNFEGGDFRDEVSSLVTLFVKTNAKLENEEFVQSFFQEIKAVLAEMASLFEVNSREGDKLDSSPQCSELLTKFCLLKAELLLVVQIFNINSSSTSSFSFSSMLSDWEDIIYECRELPRNLS